MSSLPEIARRNGMLGGRPPGSRSRLTILKEKKRDLIDKKIAQMSKKIINAQAMIALGTHRMVKPTLSNEKIEYITIKDENEIDKMLTSGEHGKDYIIIMGNDPDWKAGNALLDRTFGKAKESIEFSGDVKFSLKGLAESRKDINDDVIQIPSEEVKITDV